MEWNPDERRRPAAHRGGHLAPIYTIANSSLDNCETTEQFPLLFDFFQRPLSLLNPFGLQYREPSNVEGKNQRCQHKAQDLIGCLVLVDVAANCVANNISAITKVNLALGHCGL